MAEEQVFHPVTKAELIEQACQCKDKGFRLAQLHCTKTVKGEMFVIYTFENLELEAEQFKLNVAYGETVPSLSGVFLSSVLYENEIAELYGVKFSGLALDFKGTLYETAEKQVFGKPAAKEKEKGGEA